MTSGPKTLVIACGALANEVLDLVRVHELLNLTVECLPARYHNEPDLIPEAVRARVQRAKARAIYDDVLVGYADCGTGGRLRRVCDEEDVGMLEGAHCYQFFAGSDAFLAMHEEELGTLYLTDFLARHFDRLIWEGFGIAEHPELLEMYFANYRRLVYLAQTVDPDLENMAKDAANRLGLTYERRLTGYGELEPALLQIAASPRQLRADASESIYRSTTGSSTVGR